MVQQRG